MQAVLIVLFMTTAQGQIIPGPKPVTVTIIGAEWSITIDGREFRVAQTVPKESAISAVIAAAKRDSVPMLKLPQLIQRPKRVVISGKYYDQYADGRLIACSV